LIFIGDSITQGWGAAGWSTWESFYAPRGGVNLGISGDRTQHVLWRLQNGHLDGIDPALAVIMIGTNNAGDNTSQEIADGVEAIVNTVQGKLPETEILILAIFPRGATPQDLRRRVNDGATAIFAALAERDGVEFLDIGGAFLSGDGTLSKDVMPDLLHLTPEAYQTWAVEIEDHISDVVGPLPR
jgi:beta-glucosidase